MAAVEKPLSGSVLAVAVANIRLGEPSTAAPIAGKLQKDAEFPVRGLTEGQLVAGQSDWYVGATPGDRGLDQFLWAGAARAPAEGLSAPAGGDAPGRRRADGTLQNLPVDQIKALYGEFKYSEGKGGAIVPDPAWARSNIVKLIWKGVAGGDATLWIHKKAKPHFEAVFAAIEARGLTDTVLTFDGSYVPRHMGWNPARALSSHSWGIAIDINARWNGYGHEPAAPGETGSVRALVDIFEAEGFAWGGRFKPMSISDGMHFELARTDV